MMASAEEFFAGIRGVACWSIIAGKGAGSVVDLNFGKRVHRTKALRNPLLSDEERMFTGERSLVVYCDWRLETPTGIVATSQSANEDGVIMLEPLMRLKGAVVADAFFYSPCHDLAIRFQNGEVLRIFCDLSVVGQDDANFVMFNPTNLAFVNTAGKLLTELRKL